MMRVVVQEEVYSTPFSRAILDRIDNSDTVATINRQDDLESVAKKVFSRPHRGYEYWLCQKFCWKQLFRFQHMDYYPPTETKFEVGEMLGNFEIKFINDNLLVLGVDMPHLKYRACLYLVDEANYNVKLTSLLSFCNVLGAWSFKIVRPFHLRTAKKMIARAYVDPKSTA
ncbi:MAG: DUF2867 domain-containing protein [Flavobacteriaceae bacterium]|nr:DUF2867 domain-containing protein [Flavobacteriaceae bacterium]